MKATGIVRRIDDLGRVVIPKEIRRTLRIREGDALEIFTDSQGGVIFKKYSPVGELSTFASQYAEVLNRAAGLPMLICDRTTSLRRRACRARSIWSAAFRRSWRNACSPAGLLWKPRAKGFSR